MQTPETLYPVTIDLTEAMLHHENLNLSDIADSIVYIPLETVDGHPLKDISFSAFFGNDIFVYGGTRTGLLRFNGKGKFLNEVGSVGSGSQDYYPGSEFSITDNPQRVFILTKFDPRKILELDFNGYYIDQFLMTSLNDGDFEAISAEHFLLLTGSAYEGIKFNPQFLACIRDKENNTLSYVKHPFLAIEPEASGRRYVHGAAISGKYFENKPLFFDEFSPDTVYSVSDTDIYPRYILDKGPEGMPVLINYSEERFSEPGKYLYPVPASMAETPNYFHIIFIYRITRTWHHTIRRSGTITTMSSPFDTTGPDRSFPPTFRNDIDGGLSVVPGKSNREGNVWSYFLHSGYLKNTLTDEHFHRAEAKSPEKRDALRKMIDSLGTSDNTLVIMAVYLKK